LGVDFPGAATYESRAMKVFSMLLVAVSLLLGVSCERHEFEGPNGTKQLSPPPHSGGHGAGHEAGGEHGATEAHGAAAEHGTTEKEGHAEEHGKSGH